MVEIVFVVSGTGICSGWMRYGSSRRWNPRRRTTMTRSTTLRLCDRPSRHVILKNHTWFASCRRVERTGKLTVVARRVRS